MRTALVTGATGFIGRHVVAGLLDRGVAVRAVVRSPAKAGHLAHDEVERVAGSLADIARWQEAITGCDAVFHCAGLVAARRRADLTAVNGAAVGRLADACAAVGPPPVLVHLSSLAAAGPAPRDGVRDEAAPTRPVSAYGASKLAGDRELAARAGRLPVTIVRPGIVFGPHDANVAAMFQSIQWTRLHAMMGFRSSPRTRSARRSRRRGPPPPPGPATASASPRRPPSTSGWPKPSAGCGKTAGSDAAITASPPGLDAPSARPESICNLRDEQDWGWHVAPSARYAACAASSAAEPVTPSLQEFS